MEAPLTESIDWPRQLDQVEAELDALDQALVRLDDGTYGVCEVCATRIDDDLLAEAPTASRCPAHA